MACMHLRKHAWHACTYACLIPCAPLPLIQPLYMPLNCQSQPFLLYSPTPPHSQQKIPLVAEGGGTVRTQDIYIYRYMPTSIIFVKAMPVERRGFAQEIKLLVKMC